MTKKLPASSPEQTWVGRSPPACSVCRTVRMPHHRKGMCRRCAGLEYARSHRQQMAEWHRRWARGRRVWLLALKILGALQSLPTGLSQRHLLATVARHHGKDRLENAGRLLAFDELVRFVGPMRNPVWFATEKGLSVQVPPEFKDAFGPPARNVQGPVLERTRSAVLASERVHGCHVQRTLPLSQFGLKARLSKDHYCGVVDRMHAQSGPLPPPAHGQVAIELVATLL